jgi:hypothetical protein
MAAPLYNSTPLIDVEDGQGLAKDVELKLTSDIAKNTLDTIEEVIASFENPVKRKTKSSVLLPKRLCSKVGGGVLLGIIVIALLIGATFLAVFEANRYVIIVSIRVKAPDYVYVSVCYVWLDSLWNAG